MYVVGELEVYCMCPYLGESTVLHGGSSVFAET